MDLAIRK